jgi:hypothetical protein
MSRDFAHKISYSDVRKGGLGFINVKGVQENTAEVSKIAQRGVLADR